MLVVTIVQQRTSVLDKTACVCSKTSRVEHTKSVHNRPNPAVFVRTALGLSSNQNEVAINSKLGLWRTALLETTEKFCYYPPPLPTESHRLGTSHERGPLFRKILDLRLACMACMYFYYIYLFSYHILPDLFTPAEIRHNAGCNTMKTMQHPKLLRNDLMVPPSSEYL